MTSIHQERAGVKTPSSFPQTPYYYPQEDQAKDQAKEQAKERARVRKHSSLYRFLLAETRRRAPYRVDEIASKIVGMDCDEAVKLVQSIPKGRERLCRLCKKPTRDNIEGLCFECYKEVAL